MMIRFFTALLCLAGAAAAENLLPNPSFEAKSSNGVEGWTSRAWSGGDEAQHEVVATGRSGHCVSIRSAKGTDAAWTTKVAVQDGKSYELSGWIKTVRVKGAAGALLNIQNMPSVKTTTVTDTSDWVQVRVVFETGKKHELEINCLFGGWGKATGQAWFDDVALREISRQDLVLSKAKGEVLQGMNGLVAAPAMTSGSGMPQRLMGVGVDDRGKVFVTETVRQMREDISLLQSTFLHEPDMALMTVEAKEAWILKNYSPRIAQAQGMQDFNNDGVVDVKDVTIASETIHTLSDADIRSGEWKLVSKHPGPWELHDMTTDRTEMNNLAAQQPDRVKDMAAQWDAWAKRVGVLPWPPDGGEGKKGEGKAKK